MFDFEYFYKNTRAVLYQYLYRHAANPTEVEDIAQEAYLKALERWEEISRHPNPAGWLMLTAKHLCLAYKRHLADRMEFLEEGREIPYVETAYNLVVMEDFLENVYGRQDQKEKEIARKVFLEGDSVSELSREMGISEGACRTRLYRMRLRMKAYVEDEEKYYENR